MHPDTIEKLAAKRLQMQALYESIVAIQGAKPSPSECAMLRRAGDAWKLSAYGYAVVALSLFANSTGAVELFLNGAQTLKLRVRVCSSYGGLAFEVFDGGEKVGLTFLSHDWTPSRFVERLENFVAYWVED
jgi:hypothetical protein